MQPFHLTLLIATLLGGERSTSAARFDDVPRDIARLEPEVASAQVALVWLSQGNVTLEQFSTATRGKRPRPDGPGYRWRFKDGLIVTDGMRLPNGEFVILS